MSSFYDECIEKNRYDLLLQWDTDANLPNTPKSISSHAHKDIYCICEKGHTWHTRAYSIWSAKEGCPVCEGRIFVAGVNDAATVFPEVLKYWDYDKNIKSPKETSQNCGSLLYWKCDKGHKWTEHLKTQAETGECPVCSGIRRNFVKIYFAEYMPKLLSEWDYDKNNGIDPNKITWKSSQKFWWKCENGHSWYAAVASRTNGSECPYCSGREVIPGVNDLATLCPDALKIWDYEKNGELTPDKIGCKSTRRVWWKCEKGHSYRSMIYIQALSGYGCPICNNRDVLMGENDLATTHPKLAKEWDYEKNGNLSPENVNQNSTELVWWKCEKGHSYKTRIQNRTKNGIGCPYCSGKLVLKGFNDFASQCPELLKEWNYEKNEKITPDSITPACSKKVWWKCEKGHEWETIVSARVKDDTACPYCSGKRLLPGFNDLKTLYPHLALSWHPEKNGDLTPDMVSPGSQKRIWWKCSQGHEWEARITSRVRYKTGCPFCAGKRKNSNVIK